MNSKPSKPTLGKPIKAKSLTLAQLTKQFIDIVEVVKSLEDSITDLEESAAADKGPTPDYAALAEAELRLRCFDACLDAMAHRDEVTFKILLTSALEVCEEIDFGPRLLSSMTMMKEREHFGMGGA